jgi:hypothetical protein
MLLVLFINISPISACTIFTVSQDGIAFFGNNEDWINPNTYMMIRPSVKYFGAVYFGFDDFYYQGGINEEGLCFDGNALPGEELNNHPEKQRPLRWIPTIIMETCTNISEVITTAQEYNWYVHHSVMKYQIHFADRFGDAVIISPGFDGELNFTRKDIGDGYLISTNYNLSYGNQSDWCWRYDTAVYMLDKIAEKEDLDVDYCRDILDAVHQEGEWGGTLYSNIFDLKTKMIYLYYSSQFTEDPIEINVTERLSMGLNENIPLKDLVSPEIINQAGSVSNLFGIQGDIRTLLSIIVVILDLLGVTIIIYAIIKRVRS